MIRNFCFQAIRHLKRWKIHAGVDPRRVSSPSLIFFPLAENILCCGLAGILTVKKTDGRGDPPECESPAVPFERIRKRHIREVLSGAIPFERYLDGNGALAGMEQSILDLKRDAVFESLFFDSDLAERMRGLSREINAFLAEEESVLEAHADRFATGDLEVINSRLVRMKDIGWALEKDILDNVERICVLAGAANPREVPPAAFGKYRKINFLLNCLDRLEVRGRDSAGIQLSFHAKDTGLHEYADLIRQQSLTTCPQIVVIPERCDRTQLLLCFFCDIEDIAIPQLKLIQLIDDKAHRILRKNRRIAVLGSLIAGQQRLILNIDAHMSQNMLQHQCPFHHIWLILMCPISFCYQQRALSIDIRLFIQDFFTEGLHTLRQRTKMFLIFHFLYLLFILSRSRKNIKACSSRTAP